MKRILQRKSRSIALGMALVLAVGVANAQSQIDEVFSEENLVAWCIVPFDAKQRGPEERAKMLADLGITKLAYDWRDEHISTFDQEWEALRQNGVDLFAFWLPSNADPANEPHIQQVFAFLEHNHIKTQLWYCRAGLKGMRTWLTVFRKCRGKSRSQPFRSPSAMWPSGQRNWVVA